MGSQTGGYSSYPLAPHDHSAPAQGGQLDPETALNPQPEVDFGDGSDGDVTLAADMILTRDMSFNNLTIPAAWALFPLGFKIKVKGKLTIGPAAYILCYGLPGGAGAGGVGGAGGAPSAVGRKPFFCLATGGTKGGNGGAAGNLAEAGAPVPNTLFDGVIGLDVQQLFEGRLWAGAGGGGGGQVGDLGNPGYINPLPPLPVLAGARGGNGGDALYTGPALYNLGGGGGGAGGDLVEIWAHEIDNAGNILATGRAGGPGQIGAAGTDEAGGGGGGGGGAILIFYKILSGAGLGARDVNGGSGGVGGDPARLAGPGAVGYSYAMRIGV